METLNVGTLLIKFGIFWQDTPPPQWARAFSFTRFIDNTQGRTTVGSTPLDKWSARRRDVYLTTYNRHAPGGIRTHNLSKRSVTDLMFTESNSNGLWKLRWLCDINRNIWAEMRVAIYKYTLFCVYTRASQMETLKYVLSLNLLNTKGT